MIRFLDRPNSASCLSWRSALLMACSIVLLPHDGAWGQSAIQLRDATAEAKIGFRHHDGSGGRYYIMEAMSAGLALFDFDRDGDIDIYFLNGAPMPGTRAANPLCSEMNRAAAIGCKWTCRARAPTAMAWGLACR